MAQMVSAASCWGDKGGVSYASALKAQSSEAAVFSTQWFSFSLSAALGRDVASSTIFVFSGKTTLIYIIFLC